MLTKKKKRKLEDDVCKKTGVEYLIFISDILLGQFFYYKLLESEGKLAKFNSANWASPIGEISEREISGVQLRQFF